MKGRELNLTFIAAELMPFSANAECRWAVGVVFAIGKQLLE